jgi:hypothetical protein
MRASICQLLKTKTNFKNIPQLNESKAYRYLGYLIAPNLKWNELRDAASKSCRNKLTLLKNSRLPALLKAQITNKAIWPKITFLCMTDITGTQLDSLMSKAQSTLRKALHASTSLSTETIYQDVENNGIGLQNLKLEMSIRLIELTKSILN